MHRFENGREILNPGFSPCHMELFFFLFPHENKESLTALEAGSRCSGCTALEIVGWMVKVESNASCSENPGACYSTDLCLLQYKLDLSSV